VVKYFRRAREQTKIKLTKNLLTIIKTTIIYGTKTSCAPLCTVHKGRFNAMYKSTEYLLPSVTVQDIVPPRCKKNGHSVDSLRGKCPMIVPFFFFTVTALRITTDRIHNEGKIPTGHDYPHHWYHIIENYRQSGISSTSLPRGPSGPELRPPD